MPFVIIGNQGGNDETWYALLTSADDKHYVSIVGSGDSSNAGTYLLPAAPPQNVSATATFHKVEVDWEFPPGDVTYLSGFTLSGIGGDVDVVADHPNPFSYTYDHVPEGDYTVLIKPYVSNDRFGAGDTDRAYIQPFGIATVTVDTGGATYASQFDDAVLGLSPIRFWKLDEGTGSTAADSAGVVADAMTAQGTAVLASTGGPFGDGCLVLDGAGYLQSATDVSFADVSGGNFTIAALVSTTSETNGAVFSACGKIADSSNVDTFDFLVGGYTDAILAEMNADSENYRPTLHCDIGDLSDWLSTTDWHTTGSVDGIPNFTYNSGWQLVVFRSVWDGENNIGTFWTLNPNDGTASQASPPWVDSTSIVAGTPVWMHSSARRLIGWTGIDSTESDLTKAFIGKLGRVAVWHSGLTDEDITTLFSLELGAS